MYNPLYCPNPQCEYHNLLDASMIIKKGKKLGSGGKSYQRYQCKACDRKFLSTASSWRSDFHKPELVEQVFKLYTSGYSLRRMSEDLEVSRTTISKIVHYLAQKIFHYHRLYITQILPRTDRIIFDELQSFEHSKHLPISIGLVKDGRSNKIISIRCAQMRAHWAIHADDLPIQLTGRYLNRRNDLPLLHQELMADIAMVFNDTPESMIVSDKSNMYILPVRHNFPNTRHFRLKSKTRNNTRRRRNPPAVPRPPNPAYQEAKRLMASFNATCASLRSYCSRLGNGTIITSKTLEKLEDHLLLMLARYNGYDLNEVLNQDWWQGNLQKREQNKQRRARNRVA